MNDVEEFDYWCAEYRDNPNMAASETRRLLDDMVAQGNFYALTYQDSRGDRTRFPHHEPDLVELLTHELAVEEFQFQANVDDLDGNEWGARTGAIDAQLVPVAGQPDELGKGATDYPPNWLEIAKSIKHARNWRCEMCGYQKLDSGLIQVHHIDGDKADNKVANLQVLCAKCHAQKHSTTTFWPTGAKDDEKADLNRHHVRRSSKR